MSEVEDKEVKKMNPVPPTAFPKKAVVVTPSLHIRKDHSVTSETVGGLKEGDEVDVLGVWNDGENAWCKLGEGKWAAMKYNGNTLMKYK
ncbi:MAG: hypothetical protein PHQ36_02220 [Anaerolineales bacterium]|nr:hypothetical protein [Anaerolineales bacterium]